MVQTEWVALRRGKGYVSYLNLKSKLWFTPSAELTNLGHLTTKRLAGGAL